MYRIQKYVNISTQNITGNMEILVFSCISFQNSLLNTLDTTKLVHRLESRKCRIYLNDFPKFRWYSSEIMNQEHRVLLFCGLTPKSWRICLWSNISFAVLDATCSLHDAEIDRECAGNNTGGGAQPVFQDGGGGANIWNANSTHWLCYEMKTVQKGIVTTNLLTNIINLKCQTLLMTIKLIKTEE